MRKLAALSTAMLLLSLTPSVQASAFTATIERILFFGGGNLVYVYPTGGIVGAPSCATAAYYTIVMTRNMAKEYLAGLLAAQARGAPVAFWGTGTCTDQTSAETLDYFRIEPQ